MKIRIGNDISLNVQLQYNRSLNQFGFDENSDQYEERPNISSIKAYLINASKEEEFEKLLKDKTKFISRFPIEPYINAYSSNAYDIKSSGYPTWRAYPYNHVYATYSGFGPNPFWPNKYRRMPEHNLTQYQAKVTYTEDRDVVKVFFPAEHQLYPGTYNLILVAKLYEPGYSTDNLRTVTMDYENIFTLVNSTSVEGVDSAVTLNVASTSRIGSVQDIEVYGDTTVGVGGIGQLVAKVSPVSVKDSSVSWSVADENALYLAIVNKGPNTCKYVALGMPAGKDQYKAKIYATSNGSPSVQGQIEITITKNHHGDIYVDDGVYNYSSDSEKGGDIELTLTSGERVNVDLSKATGWYEGV